MAALKSLKDITDNFEEQLTCSICHDIFTDPKTLPCLHSYCTRCIVDWYEKRVDPLDYKINCPMCKTTVVVPDGDPSKLPPSFYFDSLLQLLHAMKTKANQPELPDCVNCEQPKVLVAFCPQCNGLICEDCVNAHKTIKQIREEHQPMMLNQFKEENVTSFIKNQMLCNVHEKKKLEYYCQEGTCRLSICQKCATLDHKNHQMQSLEDAGQDSRKLIEGAMNRVEQRKKNDGQELEQSKENIERIQRQIRAAEKDVDEAVQLICNMAREHGEAMKNELTQTLQELTTANNEEQTAIKTRLNDSDGFVQHCQALLERDVAYEEIESKEMILERAKILSEAPSTLSTQPIQRDVTIRYSVTEQVMQSLLHIGCIVKNVTDPARSTIESVKTKGPRGFINECKIITRNAEGEVCPTTIEFMDVRIIDVEGNMYKVENQVSEEETGKYRVSFKPQKTGRHEIQVNIAGETIKNSPQNVDIVDVKELFKPVKTFGVRGSGRGQLNNPRSIAVSDGEIAIADWDNHRIQIFGLDGNYLRKFGGEGTGEGQLYHPCGVVFNEDRMIVIDSPDDKGRIQEYDVNGTHVRTIYRHEQWLYGMCVDDDKSIAACCEGNQELGIKPSIKVFSKQGDLVHEFDMPDNNEQPEYITYGNGKYFVSIWNKNYVRVFDVNGVFLYKFGEEGQRDGQFNGVYGLAVYGPDMILICDTDNHRVQRFTQEGQFIRSFGSRGSGVGEMNRPGDVVVTADGRVFVLEFGGNRVSVWCH